MDLLKVLLLEDDPVDAELIKRLLKKDHPGWQTHVAENRQQFIAALEVYSPDVVLSDNSLPDCDAREALAVYREYLPFAPFILVTGTVPENFAVDMIKAGADDYFLKDRLLRLPSAIEAAVKKRSDQKDRQKAMVRLVESEENHRTVLERVSDLFISLNAHLEPVLINSRARVLPGLDPQNVSTHSFWDVTDLCSGKSIIELCRESIADRNNREAEILVNPGMRWLEVRIYAGQYGLSLFLKDITDKKHAESKLVESNLELRRLTDHLKVVLDKERQRIGRELHDELGQHLTAMKLELAWLKQNGEVTMGTALHGHNILSTLIDLSHESVRRVLSGLLPVAIENGNLLSGLKWLAEQCQAISGILVMCHFPDLEPDISQHVASCIYRVVQEALNNVVKYSRAETVSIVLKLSQEKVFVSIADDGEGFDLSIISLDRNFGISGMRERVEALGGTLHILTAIGEGTAVNFELLSKPHSLFTSKPF